MKWIGIHGASESGKDTAADYIITTFGGEKVSFADPLKHLCRDVLGFTQIQLWGPSKHRNEPVQRYIGEERAEACHIARVRLRDYGPSWIVAVLPYFGPEKRATAFTALVAWLEDCLRQPALTPRYALQTLGTEWGRAQDPDIWLWFAKADVERRGLTGYAVIPDCRFLNEAQFLQRLGAPLIEVIRPGHDGSNALAAGVAAHASEMSRILQADAFRPCITHTINNDSTLEAFKERIWGVISPEIPWPNKSSKPSIESTDSTSIASGTDTPDSSPSTSSTTETQPLRSPTSTNENSPSSQLTTGKPKAPFGSGPKTTLGKGSGTGPNNGRKS